MTVTLSAQEATFTCEKHSNGSEPKGQPLTLAPWGCSRTMAPQAQSQGKAGKSHHVAQVPAGSGGSGSAHRVFNCTDSLHRPEPLVGTSIPLKHGLRLFNISKEENKA